LRPVPADASYRLTPTGLAPLIARDRAAGVGARGGGGHPGGAHNGGVGPLGAPARPSAAPGGVGPPPTAPRGGAGRATPGRAALGGIGRADSVTLDPHKWLAQTFEAGGLLVRDGRLLARAFTLRPDYMQDVEPGADEINFADHGLALTRRFRALKIWLSLKV